MDQDQYVAMASLDLSAAFHVVNVDLLLVRLRKVGLPTDIINLLESWLKDRQCYVELRNSCSQYFDSDEGTVQGSILGPVLFSLFMSPLLEKEDLISYADDSYMGIAGSESFKQIIHYTRKIDFIFLLLSSLLRIASVADTLSQRSS
jgi:hypothetical protein